MAPRQDQGSKEGPDDAANPAGAEATPDDQFPLVRRLWRFLGFGTQDATEVIELKEENGKLKSLLEDALADLRGLHELQAKYRRRKDSERATRREKEELHVKVRKLEKEREEQQQTHTQLVEDYRDAQNECHELKKTLRVEVAEKRELQDQVAQFKQIISSSSRMENQVADDVIRRKSDEIFYAIQNFVVTHFRGAKFDFTRLSEHAKLVLRGYAPRAEVLPKAFWLNIVNSVIAQVMISKFKPESYFGQGQAPPVAAAAELAKTFGVNADAMWFITTRKLLTENAKDASRDADHQLAGNLVNLICSVLQDTVSVEWTHSMRVTLSDILDRAQDFYRLVYSQKPQIKVMMPMAVAHGDPVKFDPKQMEIVNGALEDDTALAGCAVEISVFPAVHKVGSSSDGPFTVITKAKVVPRT